MHIAFHLRSHFKNLLCVIDQDMKIQQSNESEGALEINELLSRVYLIPWANTRTRF